VGEGSVAAEKEVHREGAKFSPSITARLLWYGEGGQGGGSWGANEEAPLPIRYFDVKVLGEVKWGGGSSKEKFDRSCRSAY